MKQRPVHVAVKNALALALGVLAPSVANAQTGTTTGTTTTPPGAGGLGVSGTGGTTSTTTTTTTTGTPATSGTQGATTAPTGTVPLSPTTTTTTTFVTTPAVVEPVVRPPDPTAPLPSLPPPISAVAPGPTTARLHDFLDTRLTWTFGDDDILTSTGQRVPVSPLPRIGDRPQYQLFFDALNSRFAGRENLTHLAMYSRAPGFIPNLVTEAALVLRFDLTQLSTGSGNLNTALYDAGTYLRLLYQTNLGRPNDGLSLTFFPFDTDRFRIGYLWDLSWGGNDVFPRRIGPAPGARIGFDSGPLSVYAGFKTASIVVPLQVITSSADVETVRVEETNYGAPGGLGLRLGDSLRFDASGGYFQQGRFDFPGVRGQQVYIYGGSARLTFNHNLPPSTSIDMQLYRNHPDYPMALFRRETYTPGELSYLLSLEGTAINQHLADIERIGQTTFQPGFAGAFQARLKYGYLGVGFTTLYRDVPFLLRNVPSFIPFYAIPREATVTPELFFAANIDYRFNALNLMPSLIVGMQLPASFSTSVTEGSLLSQRTLVIRRAGNFSILPPGESALPIISARLTMRWDLSTIFATLLWLQYVYDPNGTLLEVDASGTRQVRTFQEPSQLGFGLTAQARF